MESAPTPQTNPFKPFILRFWLVYLVPIALTILVFVAISSGLFGRLPSFEELENPRSNLASEIISSDQKLLGKFYFQNRSFIGYRELSPHLVNALLATEDIRFYKHSGVDFKALLRVIKGVILGTSEGGGSTITQQLAKNLVGRDSIENRSFVARPFLMGVTKFKEWITAIKLERNFTKDEIMLMYFNTVPFGSQAYGIKSAASIFYNTTPDSVKIEEAAMLVGLLKAPTFYSPVRNPDRAKTRRDVVLNQMARYDFISRSVCDSLKALPIVTDYHSQNHNKGLAPYFREYLRMIMNRQEPEREDYASVDSWREDSTEWVSNPLFGWCRKNLKADGTPYNLYRDGLKIYTTIDSRMQQYAEEAVAEHLGKELQPAFFREKKKSKKGAFSDKVTQEEVNQIIRLSMQRSDRYRYLKQAGMPDDSIRIVFSTPVKMTVFSWKGERDTILSPLDSIRYYKMFLRAGLMAMDPSTGQVKAYVGGPNFDHFKYDQVKISKRQVGSTVKPFLYTLAMQEGYSPCYMVPNVPTTFTLPDGTTWTPKNSGETDYDGQMVTLKWGLANSVNYISAWLMSQFKPMPVVNLMRHMGIRGPIDPVPALILGTPDISLYEMVGAYGTFANEGVHTQPIFVTRIEDKNGNVLATFSPQKEEAFSEQTAYLMLNLLQGVVNGGTGSRLRFRYKLGGELGGKTGTTDNHSDGWFMGLHPHLVGGVWVGGEERSIHFDRLSLGQGANMALPIYGLFLRKVFDDTSLGIGPASFKKPATPLTVDVNCDGFGKKGQKPDPNPPPEEEDFF